jgi:very-short-patch-repair endonuclease
LKERTTCDACGVETKKPARHVTIALFCEKCVLERAEARRKKIILPCRVCGVPVTLTGPGSKAKAAAGSVWCSLEHKKRPALSHRSTCDKCGRESGKLPRHKSLPLLCEPCRLDGREQRAKKVRLPCVICKKVILYRGKDLSKRHVQVGRGYCSEVHKRQFLSALSANTLAKYNRQHAAVRMRQRNPMRLSATRAKMRRTLLRIGHAPRSRGGNGRGPTLPERTLAERLGWKTNVIVRTSTRRSRWRPYHYKIDVADETLMIAIEVDGSSHTTIERQRQDRRKDQRLRTLGWTVLRFSNQDVMERLEACVRTVSSTISRLRRRTPTSRTA